MTVSPVWKLLRESNNGAVGAAYHHNPRLDLLTLLDRQPRKVLDVGCATGATGQALRQRFPEVELWGVEQNAAAAKIAAQTYRTVFRDVFSHVDFATSGLMPESIDTVILADVLEHMADPWDTLQRLLPLLHPNAQLLVSLPNARNLWLLNELAEGRWTYEDQGIMDVTHLRFFTRAEGQRMLEETGYRVEGIAWGPDSRFLNAPVPQHFPTRIESEKIVLKDVTAADFQELVSLQIFFRAGLGTSLPKSHGDTHTTPNDSCCFSGPLRQSQTAVILHLFYAELWDEIADALSSLGEDFNLYVSVTEPAESLVSRISQQFPSAQIFVRSNRGRDIAPRLALAKAAISAGHECLLFIHSKKSPHLRQMKPEQIHVDFLSHGDGDRWRRDLLDNLLAPSVVAHVRERFTSAQRVGMIGPAGFWLPLEMVKDANRPRVGPLMDRLGIMIDPRRYGFFAGSMFWARAQALAPLLALDLKPEDFEEESGQVDGTLAHAIERLFAVVTERAGFVVEDTTSHECLRPLGPLLPWLAAQRWSPQESLWAQQALANGISSTVIFLLVMENGREASAQATHSSLSQQWSPVRVGAIAAGDDPMVIMNITLAEMDTDWLAVLDAGDELAPDATFRLAQSIQNHPEWQIIYTDEDSLTAEGEHVNPHCKPDFNLDYLRSLPYIGGLMLIKKTLFDALDGFDPQADGAEDYDFLLRAWERVGDAGIGHIPEVLYHRHQGSSHCRKSVPEILEAGRQALVRHFERASIAHQCPDVVIGKQVLIPRHLVDIQGVDAFHRLRI